LGLEDYVVWGLAAGVLNTIPYFGPIIITAGLPVVGHLQLASIGGGSLLAAERGAARPHRPPESHPHLRQPAVLELAVGRVGHAAGGADADGGQGRLRSQRGAAAARGLPRRVSTHRAFLRRAFGGGAAITASHASRTAPRTALLSAV